MAAVGINCTAPEYVSSLIDEIRKGTDKPIIIYPNSGESYDAENKTWHGSSSDQSYGKNARLWYDKGAKIIGGCCRTRPEDIKEINSWGRNLL